MLFETIQDLCRLQRHHLSSSRHRPPRRLCHLPRPMVCAYPKLNDTAMAQLWSLLEGDGGPEYLCWSTRIHVHRLFRPSCPALPQESLRVLSLPSGACLWIEICSGPLGKIVLIEDVGEAVYRADRSLWQLRNAGVLDDVPVRSRQPD